MQLRPIENREKYFFLATGMCEIFPRSERHLGKAPLEDIGKCGYNNGVRCFVNEARDYYVGRDTEDALKVLVEAGYRNVGSNLNCIPFSNGGSSLVQRVFEKNLS